MPSFSEPRKTRSRAAARTAAQRANPRANLTGFRAALALSARLAANARALQAVVDRGPLIASEALQGLAADLRVDAMAARDLARFDGGAR